MINQNEQKPSEPIVFISFSPTSKVKKMLDKAGIDVYMRVKESKKRNFLSQQTLFRKKISKRKNQLKKEQNLILVQKKSI